MSKFISCEINYELYTKKKKKWNKNKVIQMFIR